MTKKHLPDDAAALDADTLQWLLDSPAPPEADDPAARARSRRRLLRAIAANETRLVTVAPAGDGFAPFAPGVAIKVLHRAGGLMAYLLRLDPGAALPAHRHPLDETCVVLEGELQIGATLVVPAGGYHLAPAGSLHAAVTSRSGALLFLHGAVPEAADVI